MIYIAEIHTTARAVADHAPDPGALYGYAWLVGRVGKALADSLVESRGYQCPHA